MNPRAVLLTGNGRRHRYVAVRLAEGLGLSGVLSEAKPMNSPGSVPETEEDRRVIECHFSGRDAAEDALLGRDVEFPEGVPLREVPIGGSNFLETLQWIGTLKVDVVLLYGTSIIKSRLLRAFGMRVLNMHLGLSPYYRGSGTNFWPLVDRRPECVGVTIHLATSEVDGGPILAQVRPSIESGDRSHEIGTRSILSGLRALMSVVPAYLEGRLLPVPQSPFKNPAYRRRDFSASSVRRMEHHFATGMIEEYLSDKTTRDLRYPIVDPPGVRQC